MSVRRLVVIASALKRLQEHVDEQRRGQAEAEQDVTREVQGRVEPVVRVELFIIYTHYHLS